MDIKRVEIEPPDECASFDDRPTILFSVEGQNVLELKSDGFYYLDERIDDPHDAYTRFLDWLRAVEIMVKGGSL